ncbi:MAG: class I adenylate-forming enzyme family protein [Gammaproteobacteria bacterium]|nr:class I adenylate-forming enzyme family protein [Gammaproteobacteria bacterium]MCY4217664.1 class I adenylate-forming enzyme family protein [Gammaproteobacteria bacterium]MCY4275727.1 class I adenylate-forming enzyme family protein [Gammaproteobacteria bacterium]
MNNLWQFIEPSLQKFRDNPAWITRGAEKRIIRYRELYQATLSQAKTLSKSGIQPGDTVGITAPNGPEFCVAALATWKLGAIVAPIHQNYTEHEIVAQISALQPKIVLVHDTQIEFDHSLQIRLNTESDPENTESTDSTNINPDEVAIRLYTSGSTGTPKIVRLSHNNIISNVLAALHIRQFNEKDRFISLLPLSHAMGLTATFVLPMYSGSCCITPRVIAAKEIIDTLNEEGISVLIAVPRLFRNIMHGLESKFSAGPAPLRGFIWLIRHVPLSIRTVINAPIRKKLGGTINCWVSGGSHLDGAVTQYFHQLGIPLRQGYGLTETSPIAALQGEFDPIVDSVGKPIRDCEAKVSNPDSNGSGEILLKGPNIMLGYESQEQNDLAFDGKWFRTGDVGQIDDAGNITLTGRIKRLIVTEAGKNIYPEELETLLERDSIVKEAGIFELDMKPVAVVSTDEENPADAVKEAMRRFNAAVSSHNRITRFATVNELPRTPLGKIAFQKLPEVFAEHEVK